MSQPSFFGEAPDVPTLAIASVASHADPDYLEAARWTIWTWPVDGTFLAEDIAARLEQRHVTTPDKRALGHVIRECQRRGWITSAGYAPARSSHGSPKVRWRRLP